MLHRAGSRATTTLARRHALGQSTQRRITSPRLLIVSAQHVSPQSPRARSDRHTTPEALAGAPGAGSDRAEGSQGPNNNKIALMKIHQRQIICVEDWTRRPPRGPHPQGFTYTLSQTQIQSYTSLTRIHTHMTILTHFHSKPVQHHVRFLTCFSFPPY